MKQEEAQKLAEEILQAGPGAEMQMIDHLVVTLPWDQVEQVMAYVADEDEELAGGALFCWWMRNEVLPKIERGEEIT